MITIVCGEDIAASRDYFFELKESFAKKGNTITQLSPKELVEQVGKSEQTMDLFSTQLVFFTENLNAFLSRNTTAQTLFNDLAKDKDIELISWEEGKSSRELKIAKLGPVKEFKPPRSIFQLLDACYPGNKKSFIQMLENVEQTQDGQFIFTMLSRHLRTLMLAQEGQFGDRTQSWQRGKLTSQAKLWPKESLIGFYEGLAKIDVAQKTSATTFTIKESLDILACYFL
jgi:hypothetical protein